MDISQIIDLFHAHAGEWWELLIRLVVACLCGAVIGYERSLRQKEAGLRTHIILALGSALVMIVSKYGFTDVVQMYADYKIQADVSRVASNIMTGVGFLGAGVIFVRGGTIKGLTTAAGIWACAGIGICVGAGMYAIGVIATLLLLLVQIILHKFLPASETMENNIITFTATDHEVLEKVKDYVITNGIKVITIETKQKADKSVYVAMTIKIAKNMSLESVLTMRHDIDGIKEFSFSA